MPFLRYVRDHRGNENTYLVHTFRRFGKTRPEVLYWFRTPPHIQVGKDPLDDGTMKVIQENFPYVKFDWPKIFEKKPPPSIPKADDDSRPRRRQKLRTEPKRGKGKKTTEKGTVSPSKIEESPNDELLANEGLVSEIKGLDSANGEESSTKAVVQPAPSGVEQETPRSSKATPRRRRRSRGNSRNRRSNSEKRDRASEAGQKAAFQEDAGNSQMDAKLKVNETEVQGNTVKELASPSEISEDMQAGVPSDKTKPSS
jgi:hypothetical protein